MTCQIVWIVLHQVRLQTITNLTTGSTTKELEGNLNNNLKKVHQWLLCNKLTLSKKKTEYTMIGRMKPFGLKAIVIKVYKSIILPYFDCFRLLWDNANNELDKLQNLQNRAVRIIMSKS